MIAVRKMLAASFIMLTTVTQAKSGDKHMEARGTFEVKVGPAETSPFEKSVGVARYELDKTWVGDFVGSSQGEMLASQTESTGAMAYVAMEQMTGTLGGRTGTFYFAHRATMTKGDAASSEMHVVVVKGTGTGQLADISGNLEITIDPNGKHSYDFQYELP
jgi:hypothetical protein